MKHCSANFKKRCNTSKKTYLLPSNFFRKMHRKLFIVRKRWIGGISIPNPFSSHSFLKWNPVVFRILFLICLSNNRWKLFSMCSSFYKIFKMFHLKKKSVIFWLPLYIRQLTKLLWEHTDTARPLWVLGDLQ